MNSITPELIDFDMEILFRHLSGEKKPVMESVLIRLMNHGEKIPGEYQKLFRIHFSLYHSLYKLKMYAGEMGYYLHLDPMRIRMLKIPEMEICHHYYHDEGNFCMESGGLNGYCPDHLIEHGETMGRLVWDPLHEFYSNPENISYSRSDLISKLMKGMVIYSAKRGEIDRALNFFGITDPDRNRIKKRYHDLAKQYHPDRMNGDETLMKRLNISYRVLMEVYII